MKNPAQTARTKSARRTGRSLLQRMLVLTAYGYVAALGAVLLALYFIGEEWWVTTALLYVPRVAYALPLPFIAFGLLLVRKPVLLWTQLVAGFLVLFPLMGLVLPFPAAAPSGGRSLRLLSFNVNSGFSGVSEIVKQITANLPDVVLIQEGQFGGGDLIERLHGFYPHVHASTQFAIASRFPILEATDPPRLKYYDRDRSPRFMRYLLDTPLGKFALYSVHPISPRGALHVHRFRDALHLLRTGALFSGDPEKDLGSNTGLRMLQIAAVGELAAHEQVPVVIAGDTNLPGLSVTLRTNLGRYEDAFRSTSSGFGYTFPAKHPFLRLDRVLTGPELRFTSFRTGCPAVSDHLCVVAEIERRP